MVAAALKKIKLLFRLLLLGFSAGLIYNVAFQAATGRREFRVRRQMSEAILLEKTVPPNFNLSTFFTSGNYNMKERALWNGTLYCPFHDRKDYPSHIRLKNFFNDESHWKDENVFNIFLAETSCNSRPSYREWCSVESMAQQNPDALVWYVMTSQEVDDQNGYVKNLLKRYSNMRIVTLNLSQVFKSTPLEKLYNSGAWHNDTKWPAANLSNMNRLAIVWHAGGFYSDNDNVCIAPITKLRNVIGIASLNLVNGAAFHFDKHHPMLRSFMEYLNKNFNPYVWGKNGPQTVSAVLRKVCGVEELTHNIMCGSTKILPIKAFNPVPTHAHHTLYQRSMETDLNKKFPGSYIIHFWNRLSNHFPVIKNSNSIYELAFSTYCPETKKAAIAKSIIF